jgi:hypothetical protein
MFDTGTGRQVAQLHVSLMMMMMIIIIIIISDSTFIHLYGFWLLEITAALLPKI